MRDQARPANSMTDLPVPTRESLARLTPEDLENLEEGLKFISAIRRVGRFFKWLIIGLLGLLAGIVMFYESLAKIAGWFRG
jgi:hypothetical protein